MSTSDDSRLSALRAANDRRTIDAAQKAVDAIVRLTEGGVRVTIHSVARESGVSRSYIYSHPAILAEIAKYADGDGRLAQPRLTARASDPSLRTRLADALERISALVQERDQLMRERERLLAEIRDLRRQRPRPELRPDT